MTTIYALSDPRTGRVRYIGRTRQPLRRRVAEHLRRAEHLRPFSAVRLSPWLRELRAAGLEPRVKVLRTVPDDEAHAAERAAILAHAGGDLLNAVIPGGRLDWSARAGVGVR